VDGAAPLAGETGQGRDTGPPLRPAHMSEHVASPPSRARPSPAPSSSSSPRWPTPPRRPSTSWPPSWPWPSSARLSLSPPCSSSPSCASCDPARPTSGRPWGERGDEETVPRLTPHGALSWSHRPRHLGPRGTFSWSHPGTTRPVLWDHMGHLCGTNRGTRTKVVVPAWSLVSHRKAGLWDHRGPSPLSWARSHPWSWHHAAVGPRVVPGPDAQGWPRAQRRGGGDGQEQGGG